MPSSPTDFRSRQRPDRKDSPLRKSRGTASVEAIIILPVFAALLGWVLWINRTSTAAIEARATARSCAWRYSQNNCEIVPDGCEGLLGDADARKLDHGAVDDAIKDGLESAVDGGDYQQVLSSVMGALLAPAINEAFDHSIQATVRRTVPARADAKQKESTVIETHYRLACNLKPRNPMDIASTAWEMFNP